MAEVGASAMKTRSWVVALAVTEGDVAEAEAAIDRLAAAPADERLVIRDAWLLRIARCFRVHAETRRRTTTIGIGTARWPHHLAPRTTYGGPRRCRDGGNLTSVPLLSRKRPNMRVSKLRIRRGTAI
jgi:hypothetical protein